VEEFGNDRRWMRENGNWGAKAGKMNGLAGIFEMPKWKAQPFGIEWMDGWLVEIREDARQYGGFGGMCKTEVGGNGRRVVGRNKWLK
jgi:hypothetical protein